MAGFEDKMRQDIKDFLAKPIKELKQLPAERTRIISDGTLSLDGLSLHEDTPNSATGAVSPKAPPKES